MRAPLPLPLVLLALAVSAAPAGAARVGFEAHLGSAWNAKTPLRIRQDGHDELKLTARWSERALELPLYYVYRVTLGDDRRGWALDLVHHKIHLDNPPPEVKEFSVSHGYNLLTLSHWRQHRLWRYGFGGGAVVAHPENVVRGRRLNEHRGLFNAGLHVAGITVSAYGGPRLALPGRFQGMLEARASVSCANVPVADGEAIVPNVALHLTAGIGWTASP